jgi:sulfur dioxygenase
MIFRQLFDATSGTYTYIFGDETTREAIVVDPVIEQVNRDWELIHNRLELTIKYIVDTHVHADHVSGALQLFLKSPSVNTKIVQPNNSGVQLELPEHQGTLQLVKDDEKLYFGTRYLVVLETPGHTDHHIALLLDDKSIVLTGDSLFIGKCARTDFQGGSAEQLFDSISQKLYTLPDECFVYPGHDYSGLLCSTIGEEKKFNCRITSAQTRDKFIEVMNNLNLPRPKLIDIAVPANLKGGVQANS